MSKTDAESSGNVVEMPGRTREESAKAVVDFVRDHPLLVIAGGIAVGAVAAAFIPRGTTRRLARRAASLAEVAGTASVLLGSKVRDRAEAAGTELREQGSVMADRLERLGENASDRIGKIGGAASSRVEKLMDPVESAASRVARKAAKIRTKMRH